MGGLLSTDRVAVAVLPGRVQLPLRLLAILLGESLLHDATSLVLFRGSVGAVAAGGLNAGATVAQFAQLAAGGVAFGLAVLGWCGGGLGWQRVCAWCGKFGPRVREHHGDGRSVAGVLSGLGVPA